MTILMRHKKNTPGRCVGGEGGGQGYGVHMLRAYSVFLATHHGILNLMTDLPWISSGVSVG